MLVFHRFWTAPFVYFFGAIIFLIVLSPLVDELGLGRHVLRILFTLMIAAAVYAASAARWALIIALCLAVSWLVVSWFSTRAAGDPRAIAGSILFISLNIFAGCLVLCRVITAEKIDLNILCGGLAIYLVIGVNWAMSFSVIELLMPGSFDAGHTPILWHEYLYLSLTTLTTLGYGDILPKGAFARIWTNMEAVTGVLYLAVLMARLVSLYRR